MNKAKKLSLVLVQSTLAVVLMAPTISLANSPQDSHLIGRQNGVTAGERHKHHGQAKREERHENREERREERHENREERREERHENREERHEKRKEMMEKRREHRKEMMEKRKEMHDNKAMEAPAVVAP